MPVIGFFNSGSPDGYAPMAAAFRHALKETGYVEGQNVRDYLVPHIITLAAGPN
jgi:hypothetical protein